jgi:hypothetical protein
MNEHRDGASQTTPRERELELEVARLDAELAGLRGQDPTAATSRFLEMAAATVDLAMADAEERVASLLDEADRSREIIDQAAQEAASIRARAEAEAANLVAAEREKVVDEVSALAEVRGSLEAERNALESYHETLRQRVQELAESMVTFMTTEVVLGSETELENPATPQLECDPSGEEAILDVPDTSIDEIPDGPVMRFAGVPVVDDPVGDLADDPDEERDDRRSSAGLFSRARPDEPGFDDLAAAHKDERSDTASLFGELGARLLEQTPPEGLADALESDDSQDEAFRRFINGDEEPDPSRAWLLRPDKS